jgi:hypothetical protein
MKAIFVAMIFGCVAGCTTGMKESSITTAPDTGAINSFAVGTSEDERAIRAIVKSAAADQPDPHVASDLDWENAFGIRYFDLKKRNAFYGTVVKPQMKDADDSTLEVKVRFIEPTVAVADEYWRVAGQVYSGETKPGADRWGRTTYFFKKEHGTWMEVLERVADLRFPYYRHYESLPTPVFVPAKILESYAGSYQKPGSNNRVDVTVNNDRLSITLRGVISTGIPTSDTDFLVFDPNDLAEYTRVTFVTTADGTVSYTYADENGKLLGVALKTN